MKYQTLKNYLTIEYPKFDIFVNDKRIVIEENKKEVFVYYPDRIIFANISKIPDPLKIIKYYNEVGVY